MICFVERLDRSQVDHFGVDALGRQLRRPPGAQLDRVRRADNRHVLAAAAVDALPIGTR